MNYKILLSIRINFDRLKRYNLKDMNMKAFKSITLLVLFAFVIAGSSYSQSEALRKNIQKLASVMQIIDYTYVDSVDMEDLVEKAIVKTLHDLDPHSAYISGKALERDTERLQGSFEGIGVTFQIFQDTILVISPIPGGPSDRLGILSGDKVITIDGEKAHGKDISNQFVFDHLRGEKGTKVDVTIYRNNKDFIDYTITRDKIPINSIDATFMIDDEIGYIKLNRFSKTSLDEFKESIRSLKSSGMKKLILDLRGNSGGLLDAAVNLSDEFLPGGRMIVYTEGVKSPRFESHATSFGNFEKGDLIIMIDEGSASASEIVSGAVQDWDRGIILGRRSFGKGLVQRPFPLNDGSVVRLTTARYYTPTGRSIQRSYEGGFENYYKDFSKRFKNGEMVHPDSIKFPDSLKYYTPGNRIVYGGGGIMPDIFVPWDSTWISDYYIDLRKKGILNQFTITYVDDNRESLLKDYPTVEEYIANFSVDDDFMKGFIELGEEEGVEYDEEGYEASNEVLKYQVKSWIARNLWDINASYQSFVDSDDALQEAIKILKDGSLFIELKINR